MYAQKSNMQLWGDYEFHYPFAGIYVLKTQASYRTLLSEEEKWRSFQLYPQFEANIFTFADLLVAVPVKYTVQTDTVNTAEITLMLGTRLFFTSGKRVETQATIRWEKRHLKNIGEGDWSKGNRLRVRGELIFPINRKSYYEDKQWYSFLYVEGFFVPDDVSERFANRLRISLGLGHRLNYNLRFETVYAVQRSRNKIGEDFSTHDNILRFRVKYYINKAKPGHREESGTN